MNTAEKFKYFLDDANYSETLALEIGDSYEFEECLAIMEEADESDARHFESHIIGLKVNGIKCNQQILFDLIALVWDIAYSHGFHDGQVECGVKLDEMED